MHEKKNRITQGGKGLFGLQFRETAHKVVEALSQQQEFEATGHIAPTFKKHRTMNTCAQPKLSRTVPTTEWIGLATPINLIKMGRSPVSQMTLDLIKLRTEIRFVCY